MDFLITTPQLSNYYTTAALLQLSAGDIFLKKVEYVVFILYNDLNYLIVFKY